MTDDWKGEKHIRRAPDPEARKVDDQRIIQTIVHKVKRRRGLTVSTGGGPWAKQITAWHKHGKIMGRRDD